MSEWVLFAAALVILVVLGIVVGVSV